jgi:hypothetical protein
MLCNVLWLNKTYLDDIASKSYSLKCCCFITYNNTIHVYIFL